VVYDWRPLPVGYTQSFISEPLPNQLTLLGSASADLWIASTDPDTDIEITLTEVRSDGQERYVQNGWLRASHRRLDEKHSTELRPRQTHLEVDAELLPKNDFAFVRVEIFPFAHVFRPGSQIRLSVEAPGGNRPLWTFDALTGKDTTNWLAHSVHRPSSLVLPVVPDVKVPAELPPCPTSLRAQPCRFYR
jgi:predicted acyl esterase